MRGEGSELPTSSICNLRSTRLMRRNVAIKSPAEASARPRAAATVRRALMAVWPKARVRAVAG